MICAVSVCGNYNRKKKKEKKENVRYYGFPSDPTLLKKWVNFCKRKDEFNATTWRICGDHFTANDFERNMRFEMGFTKKNIPKLKPGSAPSLYKDTSSSTASNLSKRIVNKDSAMKEYPAGEIEEYVKKIKQLQQENFRLKLNEDKLQKTIKSLQIQLTKSNYANKNMETRLKTIFSDAQISKLKNGGRRVKWSEADIVKSITLYSAGSRAYKMLKEEKFPLPSVRTLQRWTQKSDPKILNFEIEVLESEMEFDETQEPSVHSSDENTAKQECYTDFKKHDYGDHSYVNLKHNSLL